MKLNKISVKNILAIQSAEIETDKPIIFVSGNNEAGKSSLRDAVSMALTGDLCRVSLKKDAAWLVNGESGMVEVHSGEHYFFSKIEKGGITKGVGIDPTPALHYVLDPVKFARVTPDERRQLLFEISGCKASAEEVMKRMVERGINEKTASNILPYLRSGFAEACKEAQGKAREAKAAWRAVTGETYGEKKAETWKPEVKGDIHSIRDAIISRETELSALNSDLEQLCQRYGAAQALADKAKAKQAEIAKLQESAGKIDSITAKLEADERDLKSWQAMVEKVRQATHGVGDDDSACHCPECNAELIWVAKDKKLVPHGDLRGNEDAAVNLPQYERNLELFANSVKDGRRDLQIAEEDKVKLAVIQKEIGDTDEGAINAGKDYIDEKRKQRKALADNIAALMATERELRQADEKTAQAMEHHAKALEWGKIADTLAPDGIPGEILQDAIKPFNERMREQSLKAGWKKPRTNADMDIMVDELPYFLMSESAKWRADCLIAEAISHVSGLKLLVIDRMDVLDGKSRGGLFVWLSELAMLNEIDTALVMGTLKQEQAETVADAFDCVSVHWMKNGVLEDARQNKEVAA